MKSKTSSAFSLIELSIVILIIGILIAGVTQSSRLVRQMKLTTARTLTQSSDVNGIKDLILWLDAVKDGSLVNSSLSTDVADTDLINTWKDQNVSPYSFVQATTARKPIYTESGINNLPTLYFDASASNTNGKTLSPSTPFAFPAKDVTMFFVMRPIGGVTGFNSIFDIQDSVSGMRLMFRIAPDGIEQFYTPSDYVFGGSALTLNTNYISSVVVSGGGATETIYRNGTLQNTDIAAMTAFTPDSFSIGSQYNSTTTANFDGYISEIIIYGRALKTEERRAVEKYLSKKYAIIVS